MLSHSVSWKIPVFYPNSKASGNEISVQFCFSFQVMLRERCPSVTQPSDVKNAAQTADV
jgi:hypothetical protein